MIEFDPETGTAQTNGQRLAGWLDWLAACVASEYKHTAYPATTGLEIIQAVVTEMLAEARSGEQ